MRTFDSTDKLMVMTILCAGFISKDGAMALSDEVIERAGRTADRIAAKAGLKKQEEGEEE